MVNNLGHFAGSVSGGCIEPFVVSEAIDLIEEGGVRELEYSVTNAQAAEVRLSCGGDISVLIESHVSKEVLQEVLDNRPLTRAVDMTGGESLIIRGEGVAGSLETSEGMLDELYCLYKQGGGGVVEEGERRPLAGFK